MNNGSDTAKTLNNAPDTNKAVDDVPDVVNTSDYAKEPVKEVANTSDISKVTANYADADDAVEISIEKSKAIGDQNCIVKKADPTPETYIHAEKMFLVIQMGWQVYIEVLSIREKVNQFIFQEIQKAILFR